MDSCLTVNRGHGGPLIQRGFFIDVALGIAASEANFAHVHENPGTERVLQLIIHTFRTFGEDLGALD